LKYEFYKNPKIPYFTNYDDFRGIGIDSSDNIYVCGGFSQLSTEYGGLVKYDSAGTLQWQRRFQNNTIATTSCTDTSGNSYVAVSANTLVKIDSSGTLQWQRTFFGNNIISLGLYKSYITLIVLVSS
jgi:hypothetical protein